MKFDAKKWVRKGLKNGVYFMDKIARVRTYRHSKKEILEMRNFLLNCLEDLDG